MCRFSVTPREKPICHGIWSFDGVMDPLMYATPLLSYGCLCGRSWVTLHWRMNGLSRYPTRVYTPSIGHTAKKKEKSCLYKAVPNTTPYRTQLEINWTSRTSRTSTEHLKQHLQKYERFRDIPYPQCRTRFDPGHNPRSWSLWGLVEPILQKCRHTRTYQPKYSTNSS